jgi:hypothetical protein
MFALFLGIEALGQPVQAQEVGLFRLGQWGGSLKLRYEDERRFTPGLTQRPTFREAITLRNRGFVISPRLLFFQWNGDFSLFQERLRGQDLQLSSAGRFLSHNLTTSLLRSSTYPFTLVWSRSVNLINLPFAGRTRYDISRLQGTLNMRGSSFPARLKVEQHDVEEEWSRAGWGTRRDQRRRIIKFDGRRDRENSDLEVSYEFLDVHDRLRSALSYNTHRANMNMRRTFGPEGANQWNSSARIYRRRGLIDYGLARIDQTLRLQPLPSVGTQLSYSLSATRSAEQSGLLHTGFASLNHRLYASLSTDIGVGGSYGSLSRGRERTYSVNGGTNYTKSIPFSGRLQIGYSRAYSYTDRQIPSTVQVVVHERHVFIGGLPILLNERNIILSSIVVFDSEDEIIFEEGEDKDYVVRVVGERVEIYRNPLGRIEEGATVFVDYRFRTYPRMRYTTKTAIFNAGLSFGPVSFYYRVTRHDQDLLEGLPEYASNLQNLFLRSAGAQIDFRGSDAALLLLAEYRDYESNVVAYELARLRSTLTYNPLQSVGLSAGITLSYLKYPDLNRYIAVYAYNSGLRLRLRRGLSFEGFGKFRIREDTAVDDESSYEFGGTLRWGWRALNFLITYERRRWEFGPRLVDERRFIAEIERVF